MSEYYTFVSALTVNLVRLSHEEYGVQPWSLTTVRKAHKCADCQMPIPKGTKAFLPVTNGYNRMHRLCPACVRDLARIAARKK